MVCISDITRELKNHPRVSSSCLCFIQALLTLALFFESLSTNELPFSQNSKVTLSCAEKVVEAYSTFHERGLEILKSGGDVKFLVYDCHNSNCGGLGNRIAGMINAFFVAVATDRILIINHTQPFPIEDTLLPRSIQWNSTRFIPDSLSTMTINLMDAPNEVNTFERVFDARSLAFDVLKLRVNTYFISLSLWLQTQDIPSHLHRKLFVGSLHRRSQQLAQCSVTATTATETFHLGFKSLFQFSSDVLRRTDEMIAGLMLQQSALGVR